jgi:multicomponent Na+:H+ antiporter subunit F
MRGALLVLTALLVLSLMGGLVRIARGPSRPDRMMAAQLFGTTGAAIALLLAEAEAVPALRDVGLVLVLLALVNTVVFVRRAAPAGAVARPGQEDRG